MASSYILHSTIWFWMHIVYVSNWRRMFTPFSYNLLCSPNHVSVILLSMPKLSPLISSLSISFPPLCINEFSFTYFSHQLRNLRNELLRRKPSQNPSQTRGNHIISFMLLSPNLTTYHFINSKWSFWKTSLIWSCLSLSLNSVKILFSKYPRKPLKLFM